MKVGYLGPKGTFSYEAANEYKNNEDCLMEYKTIPETIKALENGMINKAVIPIENSLQGCVTDAIDTLIQDKEANVMVIDEILLNIRQNLMIKNKCGIEEIKKVYSHPQAIAQWSNFLNAQLKNAEIIPIESTAEAARKVSNSEEKGIACIGNISCLEEYNLILLHKDIQDNNFNKTRFWILSKTEKSNKNKTKMSMIFSVKDKPGALYNVLEIFNKYHLNLTKIESRPAKTVLGEYIFWIDISIENGKEMNAINEIKNRGLYVRILGKY